MPRKDYKKQIDEKLASLAAEKHPSRYHKPKVRPRTDWEWTQFMVDIDDPPLREAFKAAGLSHLDPDHWWKLLAVFVDVHFLSRNPGKTMRWTRDALAQLHRDFSEMYELHPKLSQLQICKRLIEHDETYSGIQASTLKAKLPEARVRSRGPRR